MLFEVEVDQKFNALIDGVELLRKQAKQFVHRLRMVFWVL
jgi:hypothetical protein